MKIKISFFCLVLILSVTLFLGCNSANDKTASEPMETKKGNTTVVNSDTTGNMPVSNDGSVSKPGSAVTTKPATTVKKNNGKVSSMLARNTNTTGKDGEIFPQFPGGQQSLDKFIADNVIYPEAAIEKGIEGTVVVSFEVDKAGMIYTPQVISPKLGYGLEVAAMKVVNKMPLWTPGRIQGKNIKTHYNLPITFKIDE